MFLQINDSYAIEADAHSWAVSRYMRTLKKEKHWKQIAWYSTLENAANGLLQRSIRCLEVDSLADAIKGTEELVKELVTALTPILELQYNVKIKK